MDHRLGSRHGAIEHHECANGGRRPHGGVARLPRAVHRLDWRSQLSTRTSSLPSLLQASIQDTEEHNDDA